jgi:formylmethanofuran dehydrogenase subunit C
MLTLNCNSATTGSLNVSAGTVLIDAASALPAVGISTSTGATLQIDGGLVRTTGLSINNGVLSLSGDARFTGGSLNNIGIIEGSGLISSSISNQASGDIRIAANESLDFTATTATTNSGLIDVIGGSIEFAARVNNQASTGLIFARNANLRFNGGLTNFGGMALSFGTTDVFGDVDNRAGATITVSGASNATFVDDVINNGALRTSSGGNTVFLGSVSGAGSFPGTGTVYLEGDLRPGNSPGLMTFGGDVVLGTFCNTVAELAGSLPSQFDRMQIGQQIEIDGALTVQLLGGFQPAALQTFPVITSNGLTGRFRTVTIPPTTPALHLKYTSTAAILTTCLADFNDDGIVDLFDYLDFVSAFAAEDVTGDFNLDEVIDFFDYLDFVAAFSTGC